MTHEGLIKNWELIQKWKDNPDLVIEVKLNGYWCPCMTPSFDDTRDEYRIQPESTLRFYIVLIKGKQYSQPMESKKDAEWLASCYNGQVIEMVPKKEDKKVPF